MEDAENPIKSRQKVIEITNMNNLLVKRDIKTFRKGPCTGFKIEYRHPDARTLENEWWAILGIWNMTGEFWINPISEKSSFREYLINNFHARNVYYDWDNAPFSGKSKIVANFDNEDQVEICYSIGFTDIGCAFVIDFTPVWYIRHRKPKWFENKSNFGQRIYL